MENKFREFKINIIKKNDNKFLFISGCKVQIHQIFINIFNNAVDAMPDGGTITVSTRHITEKILIEIKDTGIGMSEEIKKHIFEPFFTTKEVGNGTGLGLSLCYELVKNHSGVIEVESIEGKGSCFRILFPEIKI